MGSCKYSVPIHEIADVPRAGFIRGPQLDVE